MTKNSNKQILTKNLAVIIIVVISILTILIIARPNTISHTIEESSLRTRLREEFGDAYPKSATKSTNVIEIDITASIGVLEIFEGINTDVWNYNGSVPGPEIRIKLGDTLKVNFKNDLPDETTIHWHGVRVPNAMDGVPGVNQDPIKPGESFIYEFTPKDAGTFWFHPHVRTAEQVERGLFGTLIVEDEFSEKYSQDVTWVIDDWRLMEDYQINPAFVTASDLMHDGRWGNVITVNGSLDEILNVNPGERIRLRLVNTSNARIYTPSFGSLDAKIIAVDGMYTKEPLEVNGFEISPGNRIDVDIKIPQDAIGKEFSIYDNFTRDSNKLATIKSGDTIIDTPTFEYPKNQNIPDWNDAISVNPDQIYKLNAKRSGIGMGMMGGIEWTINNKAFPDYDPFILNYNEFNKIKFINESYRLHPMHLHGQFFKVISRNGQPVDEPFFRDTILLKGQETIEIGIVPLDKGKWVTHCHILEHAEAGMLTIVEVK